MDALETPVFWNSSQNDSLGLFESIYMSWRVSGDNIPFADASSYWQWTWFDANVCATCYIKVSLDTADNIYECICHRISFV
jgi:hypothetical protein